ncbi:MAG: glycine--tRNA ligase [archaeon]
MALKKSEVLMDLALRRSIFFPSAEIYGDSFSGFWDYGFYGTAIKNKIIEAWRKDLVEKEGFIELDGAQILPEKVFLASGHLNNFNDPLIQCEKCHSLHRADSLLGKEFELTEGTPVERFDELISQHKIKCPSCKGNLGKTKKFNLMMGLDIGATGKLKGFLRPETCQNIFLNFSRIYKTMRKNLAFGIAQTGKCFRNEIAPRNSILRIREISQMEIEVFFNPDKINEVENFSLIEDFPVRVLLDKKKSVEEIKAKDLVVKKIVSGKLAAYYLSRVQQFFEGLGIPREKLRFREVSQEERAFYALEGWDFEVETSLGWIELVANNYRSDYDLKNHSLTSGANLKVKEEDKEFFPHVWEISAGVDRTLFVLLELALREETKKGENRLFLSLSPKIAPFTAGVFPLVNKDGLDVKAKQIFDDLLEHKIAVFFDSKGSIGKRYARIDEIGVSFALTIDFDSLKDDSVTIRERDSTEQKRIAVKSLPETLWKLSTGKTTFTQI